MRGGMGNMQKMMKQMQKIAKGYGEGSGGAS